MKKMIFSIMPALILLMSIITVQAQEKPDLYDLIIRNGKIYDGSGSPFILGDVAVNGDSVMSIGDLTNATGRVEIDATGLAVSPGFINMLSWASYSLLSDGHAQSDIRQGVTLEVMGEGWSMGPLNDTMKADEIKDQGDLKFDIEWTTLGEYLDYLVEKGVSPNIASFVGTATLRIHEIGYENRPPTPAELARMKALTRQAMAEGALGLASALIYAPATFAKTDELIELAKVVAEYDGLYISHMRSEANRLFEAVDELLTVAQTANIRTEIYHLKAAGMDNWTKMGAVISKIETARANGLLVTANMYTYTAGATGLDVSMPPWVREGGLDKWIERLKTPDIRQRLIHEITAPSTEWENFYLLAGKAENILLIGFKADSLKYLTGKTLAEVAAMRGKSPVETMFDLVIEDHSRIETIYFLMSEDNVRKTIALPWVSFCSDEAAPATEGIFLKSNPHPRAYGSFARLLGKYVRDEKVLDLAEAIRKLSGLPAQNLKIKRRGQLKPGFYADIVIFDPNTIQDHATYQYPHQYATGVKHVFVNGTHVLKNGEHTGATPGRVVHGPGWKK